MADDEEPRGGVRTWNVGRRRVCVPMTSTDDRGPLGLQARLHENREGVGVREQEHNLSKAGLACSAAATATQ